MGWELGETNLHAVWDDGIIKRRGMDYQIYAKKLEEALKPEAQKAFLAVMDPIAWATESHHLAQTKAYRNTTGELNQARRQPRRGVRRRQTKGHRRAADQGRAAAGGDAEQNL